MTDLSGNGVTVTLPTGWEGRLFRRPAPGELQAQAADGPPAPEGATTNTVVHLATIPLPNGVGDFASGAVERLGDEDALIVVFEYDAASASQPLFAREGFPRVLEPGDFSPSVLQRTIRGQAGAQIFFHDGGRAFCLYVVLGGYNNRVKVVAAVNKVLATFSIDGGTVPASTNTVVDVIAGRADLTVFSALLTESGLVELLKSEPTVTVFAPVDSAFDPATLAELRADPARLERTLLHHFLRERLAPEVLRTRTTLMSAAGAEIAVTTSGNDAIAVDGVDLAPTPADGTNGVVYAIRGVLGAAFVTELAGPVAIAAVLLAAGGVAKAWRPGDTARALRMVGIRVPPEAVRAGAVAEVVVGLGALFVPGPVFPALVALSYLAFAVFVLQALRTGAPISSCGCFGKVDTPPSRVHVVLDGLFAVAAAVVAVAGTDVSMPTILPDQPLAGVPFVMLVAVGAGLVFVAFTSLPRTLAAARETS